MSASPRRRRKSPSLATPARRRAAAVSDPRHAYQSPDGESRRQDEWTRHPGRQERKRQLLAGLLPTSARLRHRDAHLFNRGRHALVLRQGAAVRAACSRPTVAAQRRGAGVAASAFHNHPRRSVRPLIGGRHPPSPRRRSRRMPCHRPPARGERDMTSKMPPSPVRRNVGMRKRVRQATIEPSVTGGRRLRARSPQIGRRGSRMRPARPSPPALWPRATASRVTGFEVAALKADRSCDVGPVRLATHTRVAGDHVSSILAQVRAARRRSTLSSRRDTSRASLPDPVPC